MKPKFLEQTIRIAHCAAILLLLTETSGGALRADDVQRFQAFLSHPPNILGLRYETSNPPLSNHIEYRLAWSRDAFRMEEFGRKLKVIDGDQTAEHVVAGASGKYRGKYWDHSAGYGAGFAAGSRLTIYEQPSPSLGEFLQDNDGKSLQEIEAFAVLHLGIRFASPDTIIFKGKTFSTLPYIGLEGAIKTIGAERGRVKELEYEYNGLKAVVSYEYDNPVFPDHSFLPSWFRTVMTTPEGEHFLTSENRIHEWGITEDALPTAMMNPELAYSNSTITRISGKQGVRELGEGKQIPIKVSSIREDRQQKGLRIFLTLSVMSLFVGIFIFNCLRAKEIKTS